MKQFSNLKKFRQEFALTQEEVSEILGITKQSVWAFENKNKIPYKHKKILEEKFNCKFADKDLIQEEDNFIAIPIRGSVTASMGSGITVYDETRTATYNISRELVRDLGINPQKSEMIIASGDSMFPTIVGGDTLLVDLSRKEIYDGKIYCVRIDGQLYAKRLQRIPPDTLKVISDNKDKYDPFYVDFSKNIDYDFAVIGEIRWWGRVAK